MNRIDKFIRKKEELIQINNHFIEELIEEIKRLSNEIEEKESKNVELKLELMREKEKVKSYEKQLEDLKKEEVKSIKSDDSKAEKSLGQIIKDIEETFNKSKSKKGNIKLDSKWFEKAREMVEDLIDRYSIAEGDINFMEAYIIIEISAYYGLLEKLLKSSAYLNKFYDESMRKSKQKEIVNRDSERKLFKEDPKNKVIINTDVARNKELNNNPKDIYSKIIEEFNINNIVEAKKSLEMLFKKKSEVGILNSNERMTVLFINYIFNVHIPTLERDLKYSMIKQGYETILYNRLINNKPCLSYIESYRNRFTMIDIKAKEKILNALIFICREKEKKENEVEYNLNEESELKKLGYTVSLGREQRWNLLKNKAIPKLGKKKIESHLRWLIKMNKGRKNRVNAVTEWEYDLRRVLAL